MSYILQSIPLTLSYRAKLICPLNALHGSMKLPEHIKQTFLKTLKGDITIHDFEQWLYADTELQHLLKPGDHDDLISLNYNKSGAVHELHRLLQKHVSLTEFETYRLLGLLKEAQQKTDRLPYILMEFYELYRRGYHFFEDLGLGMGLSVTVPKVQTAAQTWQELTPEQQTRILQNFHPELDECLARATDWLETEKIIPTGMQPHTGRYTYEDHRTEAEKKSLLWTTETEDKAKGFSIRRNRLDDKAEGSI